MFIPIENCATESRVVPEKSISIFAIGFRSMPSRCGPFDNQSVESSFSSDSPLNNTAETRATTSNLAEIHGIPSSFNLDNTLFNETKTRDLYRDIRVRKNIKDSISITRSSRLFSRYSTRCYPREDSNLFGISPR